MKLARVEHWKCGEPIAWTYVWVVDNMGAEEFMDFAALAQKSWLNAEEEFNKEKSRPNHPGYSKDYEKYPDKTVAEVQAIFAEERRLYNEWEAKRDKARKPFSFHLEQVSNGRIQSFYRLADLLEADVNWGHRHGLPVGTEDTGIESKDLPGSQPYERYL